MVTLFCGDCPFFSCFWSSNRRNSNSYSILNRRDFKMAVVKGFSAKYNL